MDVDTTPPLWKDGALSTMSFPNSQLAEISRTMAEELAAGPTVAHIATKKLAAVYLNEGIAASDTAMAGLQKPIFQSEDLTAGLKAFREAGPGHAVFSGR